MTQTASKSSKSERAIIFSILHLCGLKRNSRDWTDYERGKRLILDRQDLQSNYNIKLDFVLDYLGL